MVKKIIENDLVHRTADFTGMRNIHVSAGYSEQSTNPCTYCGQAGHRNSRCDGMTVAMHLRNAEIFIPRLYVIVITQAAGDAGIDDLASSQFL